MKKILILGATGGIGSAILTSLPAERYEVVGTGASEESVRKTHEKFPHTSFQALNLENQSEVEAFAKNFEGEVDWIINSAGYILTPATPLEKEPSEEFRKTFEINLFGPARLFQLLLPRIRKGIVNISSTSGVNGNGNFFSYSLAKAAVNSLGQTLAREFSFRKDGRTSIVLCPAGTKTAMRMRIVGSLEGAQEPETVAVVVKGIIEEESEFKNGDIVIIKDGAPSLFRKLDGERV